MSKKKKESKKERKQRIHRNNVNDVNKYYYSKKIRHENRIPATIEEAVAMGILK